jgi:hypothetical protein
MFKQILIFLFFCLLGSPYSFSQTLENLESIVARYETLNDFLNDSDALERYRASLKIYLKEESAFDPLFDKFIEQIKDVSEKIPGFDKAAWKTNPDWKNETYSIRGEFSGTGLELKRDASLSVIDQLRFQAARGSGVFLGISDDQRESEIKKFISEFENFEMEQEQVKELAGFLRPEEFESLSRAAKAEYKRRIGSNKKVLSDLKANEENIRQRLKPLSADIVHDLLNDERVSDKLFSGDADIMFVELEKFKNFKNFLSLGIAKKFKIPDRMLDCLSFKSQVMTDFLDAYQKGIQSMKDFQRIADPRMSPGLNERIQELHAQGVEMTQVRNSLDPDHKQELENWIKQSQKVRQIKQEFRDHFEQSNRYFFYELHDDPARATLRLKNQAGAELFFKPTPRAFHAFFAGRKKGECVGGASCASLTPRRWAIHALQNARTLFVESGDGRMEGYVGLTPIKNEKTGEVFHVVDIMSHALKGDIILKDKNGFVGKKSFFDEFVEEEYKRFPQRPLVISDGSSVSMNVGAAQVVQEAPAYIENVVVGKPVEFSPLDPLSEKIVAHYEEGMYQGGMIYDGMKKDGKKVVRLIPSFEQKKKSKAELEESLILRCLKHEIISDSDPVWKIARNSGVRLKSLSDYRVFAYNIRNSEKKSVSEFTKDFMKAGTAKVYGTNFDSAYQKSEALFLIGRMNAADAFAQDHLQETIRLIQNDCKRALEDDREPYLGWEFVSKNKNYFINDQDWKIELENIFRGFVERGESVLDLKTNRMQNFKKLIDLDQDFFRRNLQPKIIETEILKISRDPRRLEDRIDSMAQFPALALEAHPTSKAFFEIELMRMISESKRLKHREIWTLLNIKDIGQMFNEYPTALLRLIEVSEQSGDLMTLFLIAKNLDIAMERYPEVTKALSLALEKCISQQQKPFTYLEKVVNGRSSNAEAFKKVFSRFPNALLKLMELKNDFLHFLISKNNIFETDLEFRNMFFDQYLSQPQGKVALSWALKTDRFDFLVPMIKAKRRERLKALISGTQKNCRSLLRFLSPF